jgi:hypothetical protein
MYVEEYIDIWVYYMCRRPLISAVRNGPTETRLKGTFSFFFASLLFLSTRSQRDHRLSISHLFDTALVSQSFAFIVDSATTLQAEYDLDFGKKNSYVPASGGDGGQGQFGAVSPNDWKVPGTSPVGQRSWPGAADGGDEPWFAEAVSTVSLDLAKAEETLKAFTKEAAEFKIAAFCEENGVKDSAQAMDELVGALGYGKFLESSASQLKKAYDQLKGKTSKEEK